MTKLGINIDHVATLRQARRETFPDPLKAALACVQGGCDGITVHLREDRRHIQDEDVRRLKEALSVPFNLEMATSDEIIAIARQVKPSWTCLVPEKREELTTEGGLNLKGQPKRLAETITKLHQAGIRVSLFIEPDAKTMSLAKDVGSDAVELHTGAYARAFLRGGSELKEEMSRIQSSAAEATRLGLIVNAGHGIDYDNVERLMECADFHEFNIGFAIVARAVFVGLETAVREMKKKIARTLCAGS